MLYEVSALPSFNTSILSKKIAKMRHIEMRNVLIFGIEELKENEENQVNTILGNRKSIRKSKTSIGEEDSKLAQNRELCCFF